MSTPAQRDRFIADTVRWINRRLAPPGQAVTQDTSLFADGLINSVRILELIAWTEQAIGRRIPDTAILMDNFWSVARIAEVFIAGESGRLETGDGQGALASATARKEGSGAAS